MTTDGERNALSIEKYGQPYALLCKRRMRIVDRILESRKI